MSSLLLLFSAAQFEHNPFEALFSLPIVLLFLAFFVVAIIGVWKMFEKAGQPGWAVLIPIFNVYIMLKIARRPGWWLLLYLIPVANIIIGIIVAIDIAQNFGKSAIFGFFLNFLLGGIGYILLGFGDAQYRQRPAYAAAV